MAVSLKEITVAHSPDSDDAFMFYALANEKLDTFGLKINQVLKDIQSLNKDAITGTYEVSAISFAAYPQVADRYALMPCGASIGFKYGPKVVAMKDYSKEDLKSLKVAIPGKLTTAYLVMQLWQPGLNVVEVPFDKIIEAVKSGEVDVGLIIHEGQLTYADSGLKQIVDLGQWWYDQTQLPLPLGGNVIRKDLGEDLMVRLTKLLRDAICYALEHRADALDYAMQFARDMDPKLADKFVGMYVNEFTVDYGEAGRAALKKLFDLAFERKIIDKPVDLKFITVNP